MMLPASFKQLMNLQHINFSGCSKLNFPPDILENMRNLETLNVGRCSRLKEFPRLVASQGSIKKLDFGGLACCMEFPQLLASQGSTEQIGGAEDKQLFVDSFASLTDLQISHCNELKSLTETLGQLTNLHCAFLLLTELTILSGCFSSSFCSLKIISLWAISLVRRISISQQCCPSLEYLYLAYFHGLEEIDSLPKSVKSIQVEDCPKLKRISPNIVLPNLESIVIQDAEDGLDELPNFAESVSLQEFQISVRGQQLKKIQGIENCRSLKTLIAHTRWEAPGIQSLENTESLRRVEMSAWNISALQPCLESIKNKSWPAECVICARTARGVENVVNSLPFPGLTSFGHTLTKQTTSGLCSSSDMMLTCGQRRSSDEAIMFCFVINSFSNNTALSFQDRMSDEYASQLIIIWVD